MKITRSCKIQSLILAAALSMGFGFVSPAFAQSSSYYILDTKLDTKLRTLGGVASEMNEAGQVVGWRSYGNAFITGPDGVGMRDLGTLGGEWSFAYAINDIGQVVGTSKTATGEEDVFITGPNGVGMTDLNFNSLGGGDYSYSQASGINDAGQVVGGSYKTTASYSYWHAFITGPDGVGMRDLGTLGGSHSFAYGINDAGQVVGQASTAGEGIHAFITGSNGVGMTDLGTLGGSNSSAHEINDAGQVVGRSEMYPDPEGPGYHAFITGPDGMGMTDLGTLGGGYSSASGINDIGQVVGESMTATGQWHAFITGPDGVGMTDLNSLVELPPGSVITNALDINNAGQVLITAAIIPEPQSYALMLAGLILLGFMARRKSLPV